jgi:hypothetical protein
MIVSSQVDWFCRTQRVGFVCRYCREALTTVTLEEPPGLETCGDRGGLRDAVPSEICANYPGEPRTLQ